MRRYIWLYQPNLFFLGEPEEGMTIGAVAVSLGYCHLVVKRVPLCCLVSNNCGYCFAQRFQRTTTFQRFEFSHTTHLLSRKNNSSSHTTCCYGLKFLNKDIKCKVECKYFRQQKQHQGLGCLWAVSCYQRR